MNFVKLTRLFIPLAIKGVLEAKRMSHDRLVERISDMDIVTRSFSSVGNRTDIQLQILDEDLIHHLLSGEANKFWLASMFSLNRSHQAQKDNAAWQAVEHYYAAYYAIHFLLRITGVSLTNLDSGAVSVIQSNCIGFSAPSVIPTGLYVLRYNESSRILSLQKDNRGSGGSHKDAWRLWSELIDKMLSVAESVNSFHPLGLET